MARKGGPGSDAPTCWWSTRPTSRPTWASTFRRWWRTRLRRDDGPATVLALSRSDAASVAALRAWVLAVLDSHRHGTHVPQDPGPMAPHFHADEAHPEGGFVHTHDAGERGRAPLERATPRRPALPHSSMTTTRIAVRAGASPGARGPGRRRAGSAARRSDLVAPHMSPSLRPACFSSAATSFTSRWTSDPTALFELEDVGGMVAYRATEVGFSMDARRAGRIRGNSALACPAAGRRRGRTGATPDEDRPRQRRMRCHPRDRRAGSAGRDGWKPHVPRLDHGSRRPRAREDLDVHGSFPEPGVLGAARVLDAVIAVGFRPDPEPGAMLLDQPGAVARHLGDQTHESPLDDIWARWSATAKSSGESPVIMITGNCQMTLPSDHLAQMSSNGDSCVWACRATAPGRSSSIAPGSRSGRNPTAMTASSTARTPGPCLAPEMIRGRRGSLRARGRRDP